MTPHMSTRTYPAILNFGLQPAPATSTRRDEALHEWMSRLKGLHDLQVHAAENSKPPRSNVPDRRQGLARGAHAFSRSGQTKIMGRNCTNTFECGTPTAPHAKGAVGARARDSSLPRRTRRSRGREAASGGGHSLRQHSRRASDVRHHQVRPGDPSKKSCYKCNRPCVARSNKCPNRDSHAYLYGPLDVKHFTIVRETTKNKRR